MQGCSALRNRPQPTPQEKTEAPAESQENKSNSDPATKKSGTPAAVPSSLVGTWQFENALGDDEQMSIYPDGRILFFYLNGHVDNGTYINGEVRQPEFGADAMMKLISGGDSTVIGHIGIYNQGGVAQLSGRAKVWSRVNAEPKDQKVIVDKGRPLEPMLSPASPEDLGPLKVPPGMIGTWQLLPNPFSSKAQMSVFRDGRVMLFKPGSAPINYLYVAGEIRSDTGAARLMLFDNITLIVLDYQGDAVNRQVSGYASVWRRFSTEAKAEKITPD